MKYSNVQKRSLPRFSGIKTFFRCPQWQDTEKGNVIILGIPFDGGSTFRNGSRMAPSRIREISSLGRGFHLKTSKDIFEKLSVFDGGDAPTNPLSIQKTYQLLEDFFLQIWKQKKRILSVGGDHSITLPILRSAFKEHGPINLIHFDAHYDTFPPAYEGEEFHHGTFLRHAVEEKLLKNIWQFGIRGPLTNKHDVDFIKKHNIPSFTVEDIKNQGLKILSQMSSKIKTATYISFDVDCLDPAFAPGTGTPMVGGLSTYEALQLLQNLPIDNLIGADVVEVNPAFDHGDITSLVAVSVLFECLHLML